jgi:uncharacterized protein YciI
MYFLLKLLPPRPTFMQDMSPEEAAIMQKHAVYWQGMMQEGKMHVLGPVADPKGAWGVGILETENFMEAKALCAADPAAVSLGFRVEIYPMPSVVLRS